MKRVIIAALVIGLIVAGLVVGLEMAGLLARTEYGVVRLFAETTTRLIAAAGYAFVGVVTIGVAFFALNASSRGRALLIVAILLVELVVLTWVCALYKLEFRPVGAMAAVVLSYVGSLAFEWFAAYLEERRLGPPKIAPGPTPRPAPISVVPETTASAPAPVPAVAPKAVAPPPVVEKPRARARRGDAFTDSG